MCVPILNGVFEAVNVLGELKSIWGFDIEILILFSSINCSIKLWLVESIVIDELLYIGEEILIFPVVKYS